MNKNFDKKKYLITGVIFTLGFLFLPLEAYTATTVYFNLENPVIHEGDTFLADLKISTPDKPINVVDGTILYDSNKLEIKEVSTGNSLFALWPKPPVFSNKKGILNFVGGTSDGFQGKNGEVLKIVFLAKNEGEAQIDFLDDFSVFLHDGQGTKIDSSLRSLSFNILSKSLDTPLKDEWSDLVSKDKTPPKSFEIISGKDPYIFNNQYFISFFTTDAESGVDYYEVQEGERGFTRVESPYLLQDQSFKNLITVKAIDKAGNERIEKFLPPTPTVSFYKNITFWIIVFIIIIIMLYVSWKKFKRKNKI